MPGLRARSPAQLWTLWDDATADDLMRVVWMALGWQPTSVRPASPDEASWLLGPLDPGRRLWISQN